MFDKRTKFSQVASNGTEYANGLLRNQSGESSDPLDEISMKFLLSSGEYLKEKVSDFPVAEELYSSKLLVACADEEGKIVGVCGMRSSLNILNLFIREGYRGQGIGTQLLAKTIEVAEKRRIGFITLTVSADNSAAFHLYCRFGFQKVMFLGESRQVLMMLSLSRRGKIAFAFFSTVRRFLPNALWFHVHSWLYKRTLPTLRSKETTT